MIPTIDKEFQGKPHVSNNSGYFEWYTPPEFLEAARAVLGIIDLDPASSEAANKQVKAKDYYTLETDGLKHRWQGRVWMNPPYEAGLIDKFASKFAEHVAAGDITAGIVLVNNATETKWFLDLVRCSAAVVFLTKRIKFLSPSGKKFGAPLQGQAILYAGARRDLFFEKFNQFGWYASLVPPPEPDVWCCASCGKWANLPTRY